jgi:hypothetical protein
MSIIYAELALERASSFGREAQWRRSDLEDLNRLTILQSGFKQLAGVGLLETGARACEKYSNPLI